MTQKITFINMANFLLSAEKLGSEAFTKSIENIIFNMEIEGTTKACDVYDFLKMLLARKTFTSLEAFETVVNKLESMIPECCNEGVFQFLNDYSDFYIFDFFKLCAKKHKKELTIFLLRKIETQSINRILKELVLTETSKEIMESALKYFDLKVDTNNGELFTTSKTETSTKMLLEILKEQTAV